LNELKSKTSVIEDNIVDIQLITNPPVPDVEYDKSTDVHMNELAKYYSLFAKSPNTYDEKINTINMFSKKLLEKKKSNDYK
jgi:hypothetical protein